MIDPQSLERAKHRIYNSGKTIREWAVDHDFNPTLVYRFLQGTQKGRSGESHRIAVALGVKKEEVAA